MKFLIKLLLSGLAVITTAYLLPGVHIDSFLMAIVVALVLALFNALVRPILVVLTIPITIFTLGLFIFVINALIILMVSSLINGFYVDGFWWALLFSIVLSLITSIIDHAVADNPKK
ncbi:MAG: phage holin family protein [Bacteroidetes bacterium]|nr:phage holin family protein [Bacteroidota bacterium]